jgi:hypothetical protein
MKKNRALRMIFGAGLAFCLVLPVISGSALNGGDERIAKSRDLAGTFRMKLPDLQVKQISVSKNCGLEVTVANIGLGGVPDSAYQGIPSVSIQLFSGHGLGPSVGLNVFDPLGKLKSPGGTVTYAWPGVIVSMGFDVNPPKIKVVIDPKNVLKEANETNNELTREVICKAKASIEIYAVDPPKGDDMCWYRGAQNTYGILWKTVNYGYPTIQKITLTCLENWDQEPYVPCNIVTTIGNNAPNTGSFFFQLPPATIHTGNYEIRIYGHGGVVSNVFAHCIF